MSLRLILILVIDDSNRLIDFNNSATRIFDWLNVKYIGTDLSYFTEGKSILEHKINPFEIALIRDGIQKHFEFRISTLADNKTSLGYVYYIRDITKQKEMLHELHNMANYDPLTNIYNRRRFMEEAERELLNSKRYGKQLSFMMLDIDHFKAINDEYGHLAGDEVIKSVIKACNDRIRATDVIGRYGGEEFVIVLSEVNTENAIKIAEYIRGYIENHIVLFNGKEMRVSISIGIASLINISDAISIEQIIHQADMALYKAKNSGRNQVIGCII